MYSTLLYKTIFYIVGNSGVGKGKDTKMRHKVSVIKGAYHPKWVIGMYTKEMFND